MGVEEEEVVTPSRQERSQPMRGGAAHNCHPPPHRVTTDEQETLMRRLRVNRSLVRTSVLYGEANGSTRDSDTHLVR